MILKVCKSNQHQLIFLPKTYESHFVHYVNDQPGGFNILYLDTSILACMKTNYPCVMFLVNVKMINLFNLKKKREATAAYKLQNRTFLSCPMSMVVYIHLGKTITSQYLIITFSQGCQFQRRCNLAVSEEVFCWLW